MRGTRVEDHPVQGPAAPAEIVTVRFRGEPVEARAGEPIAAALWAAGILALGRREGSGAARGLFCGIGHCMECRVTVDGVPGVRACLRPVRGGEEIEP